jgi:hypothetical protein
MAAGKKSFVLYTSYVHAINLLSDEQAGKLLKHIFNYVNDLDPVEDDVLVRVAFEPIKQQLKRDLIEWKSERKRRSNAGKKGMEKRWSKSITKDNTTITDDNSVINPITKITVDVNENVYDNVNVDVNVFSIERCLEISLGDPRWVKANKTNIEELAVFNDYLVKTGQYSFVPKDYKKYFSTIKSKYPHLLKKEYTVEELKEIAKQLDETYDKQSSI